MPWFRVDDQLPNLVTTTRIPRTHRRAAVGLWVLAGAWSAGQLTDGHIPEYMLEELSGTPEDADWLVRAGFWALAEDGWRFIDWAPDQPLRAAVLEQRRKNAEKVSKWRARNRVTASVTNSGDNSVSDGSVTLPPSRPDPDPSTPSSLEEGGETPSLDSPFCKAHPNGTDQPCRACGDARRRYDGGSRSLSTRTPAIGRPAECPKHPGFPHPDSHVLGCDRCNEEATAAA